MSKAHCIIVWSYYHELLTKKSSILAGTHFGIFRYFSNKREVSTKKYLVTEIICFKVDFIEKFAFVPYLWGNYLLFLYVHILELFRVLGYSSYVI